jgi:SAM-dependent methyltransferase
MRLPDLPSWLARARHRLVPLVATGEAVPVSDADGTVPGAVAAHPDSAWSAPRLAIADALWGEGCQFPGGAEEVLRLAAPLGLSAAASLLLVGAGGGGAALRLAGELGVWVCACESDAGLAAAAAHRARHAGAALAKRVTVQGWDKAAPEFRRGGFHHAIAIESLHGGDDAAALVGIAQALRPGGQLVVMETVAGPASDPADPALRAWSRLERRAPPDTNGDWVSDRLVRLGLEIHVAEDATARQVLLAVAGWKRLVREMRGNRPTPAKAAALVAEAELWLRRISLMRSGQLRVMRWHAMVRQAGGSQASA